MKCLLVEDDQALARELSQALQDGDWIVELAENGQEADFLVRTEAYDTVILDIGLPDGDGTRWLSSWREDGIDLPVLILTARERWADKAAGFTAGADDYVTKPFEPAEVLFRLRALVRRTHGHAHPVLKVGELSLDTHTQHVTGASRELNRSGNPPIKLLNACRAASGQPQRAV